MHKWATFEYKPEWWEIIMKIILLPFFLIFIFLFFLIPFTFIFLT